MDLSGAIFDWASSLPLWQQQLVREVAATPLLDDDVGAAADEVAAAFGVGGPPPNVSPLDEPELGLAGGTRPTVALTALGNLSGVGVVASGQVLTFAPAGLTIVYGLNAAGKSSYVRLLKHACRSADRRSRVLSNVYTSPPARRTAKVEWEISRRPQAQEIDLAKAPPDELAGISVFDARCAAVYVAGNDVVAYVPTSLHLFKRLADAQSAIRALLQRRAIALRRDKPAFDQIPAGSTARADVDALSTTTNIAALRTLATVTQEDRDRLEELDKALVLDDEVERKARAVRARGDASDAKLLAERLTAASTAISDTALETLESLRQEATAASAAAELAAREAFTDQPGDAKIGTDPWRELWTAARRFCTHEGQEFPSTNPGSRCPLCLQELDEDARRRFDAFEAFVRGEIEAQALHAAARRDAAVATLQPEIVDTCRTPFLDGLAQREVELHKAVTTWLDAAELRRAAAAAGGGDQLSALPESPVAAVRSWAQARDIEARTLERAGDPEARATLAREALHLRGRIALEPRVDDAVAYVEALHEAAKLDEAFSALATNAITAKQGALTDQVLTRTLRDELNRELTALGLDHIQIDVDRFGASGASQVRMSLTDARGDVSLADVLSEGEQGALALAFFLAELGAAEHDGAVIFDDPVSSLDLQRRSHIARRLCEEAQRRQVAVFTHDLPFVLELRDEAKEAGITPHDQTVWRAGREAGRVQDDAPFLAMPVGKRIGSLKERLVHWPKPSEEPSLDAAWGRVRDFYNDLRETWEMAIENPLFKGVVRRLTPHIHTKLLRQVTISDQDKADVDSGMTRCSRFLHSQPAAGGMPLPDKMELAADLAALESFVDRKNKESKGK